MVKSKIDLELAHNSLNLIPTNRSNAQNVLKDPMFSLFITEKPCDKIGQGQGKF